MVIQDFEYNKTDKLGTCPYDVNPSFWIVVVCREDGRALDECPGDALERVLVGGTPLDLTSLSSHRTE